MPEQLFSYQQLFDFTKTILQKIGCSETDAEVATKVLLSADLRGVDSHGVARLSGYVRLWEVKRINTAPVLKILHESPSTAVVDGDSGLGLVVAPYAMNVAIEKAKQVGTGWVSVQNSNHFGIASYHAMMALDHDMIGIALNQCKPASGTDIFCRAFIGNKSHLRCDSRR
jgi:LDH2 family malate/lactate/ureidoglycolate dehydrogenase